MRVSTCPSGRLARLLLLLSGAAAGVAQAGDAQTPLQMALGATLESVPAWLGASRRQVIPAPYVSFNWQDRVEVSTVDGLTVDLLHGQRWHGGIAGDYDWGRSRRNLGPLVDRIGTVPSAFLGGAYLEYDLTSRATAGVRLLQDLGRSGKRAEAYLAYDLPDVGLLSHSLQFTARAADSSLQNRYLGVATAWAERLGTPDFHVVPGLQQVGVEYDAVLPTSERTGLVFRLGYARLVGSAAMSPLVQDLGTRSQFAVGIGFVYRLAP